MSLQSDEEILQMSYQICKAVAKWVYWKPDRSLEIFETILYSLPSGYEATGDLASGQHSTSKSERLENLFCAAIVVDDMEIFKSILSSQKSMLSIEQTSSAVSKSTSKDQTLSSDQNFVLTG